jgi:hypothetical protein
MAMYQSISEFLNRPFGTTVNPAKLVKYNTEYKANRNKIILNAHTKIDDAHYYHVKIPSESQKDGNVYYDVVIRFFSDKKEVLASPSLQDYYIQFFSNSPGFIYHYAVLYKNNGYLIESFYNKLDPRYFDKLPVKTNAKMELSYDKSIYFTCCFLNEKKFKVLSKFGSNFSKKLQPKDFFREIKDFQSVKYENELLSFERKAIKDLSKKFESNESDNNTQQKTNDTHRKTATKSTIKDKQNSAIAKKTATSSTSGVKSVIKKTAGKSTVRK